MTDEEAACPVVERSSSSARARSGLLRAVERASGHAGWCRVGFPLLCVLIGVAMAGSMARYGGPIFDAASHLSGRALAASFVLCLLYRLVNAGGWGLLLRALHEPVGLVPTARVWLASEACRWLPGSLWSFGSRAVLASRRGLGAHTVAASLALELIITAAAWMTVAAMGGSRLRLPTELDPRRLPAAAVLATLAAVLAAALWASRSSRIRRLYAHLRQLATLSPDSAALCRAFLFYIAMGILNGAALLIIVRSVPKGTMAPAQGVIAANAIAWVAGFFALFAPGGLVVREACLTATLATWIAVEDAVAIALAWRLLQVLAEGVCYAAVAAAGLPDSLRPCRPLAPRLHAAGTSRP